MITIDREFIEQTREASASFDGWIVSVTAIVGRWTRTRTKPTQTILAREIHSEGSYTQWHMMCDH